MKRPDGDIKFIIHVAAVSCAATVVPETRLANQILRKTRFRHALGVEFIFIGGGACIRCETPNQNLTMRRDFEKIPESIGQTFGKRILSFPSVTRPSRMAQTGPTNSSAEGFGLSACSPCS
jgi:hypothetical protein